MKIVCVVLAWVSLACSPAGGGGGGGGPTSGTVTVRPEEGVDFSTGKVQHPGNFQNSDLYATNSSTVKLASGGPASTKSRPVTWFVTPGKTYQIFTSLDEVPEQKPLENEDDPLLNAQPGIGFVVLTAKGTYARGWIEKVEVNGDTRSVTLQYELF